MAEGKIREIIGAIVDIEFPSDGLPAIYNRSEEHTSELQSP